MFRGEKLRSGPVSRVLSWATISLGRRLPAASSSRPEGDYGPNRPARPLARPHPLCLALLPVGFTLPFRSPGTRCALTAPFHPYRWTEAHRRYVFCGTVPVLADGGRYPPRRPAEPGLSSPRSLARRSPGPLRSTFIVSDAGEQRGMRVAHSPERVCPDSPGRCRAASHQGPRGTEGGPSAKRLGAGDTGVATLRVLPPPMNRIHQAVDEGIIGPSCR